MTTGTCMATRTVLQVRGQREQTGGETTAGSEQRVRSAQRSPGGGGVGDDGRLRLWAPTPVWRGRHGHYPRNADCRTDDGSVNRAGPVSAPQDVRPLGGRPFAGLQQRLWGGQHALVRRSLRGAQLVRGRQVRLVFVDNHDVLGHLFELVNQALAFDLGQDTALVIISATGDRRGERLRHSTILKKRKPAHIQTPHLRARPIVS